MIAVDPDSLACAACRQPIGSAPVTTTPAGAIAHEACPRITEPGVYPDMPAEAYHADPALSSSGARALLPPSCPARFRHEQLHGQPHKRVWDLGHAAHKLVLGAGDDLVVIAADSYRTKVAKETRDGAYADGLIPLLAEEYKQVEAMAAALRAHPVAGAVFHPDRGQPEQSLWWRDGPTGVMRRARLDWLPEPRPGRRLIIPEYKTCASADPEALSKAVHTYGYHQQADWYLTAARALGLAGDDAGFIFVCQEKAPPYLVSVIELDGPALRIGAARNRRALEVYAHCVRTGSWPAYVEGVGQVGLPRWAEIQEGEGQL